MFRYLLVLGSLFFVFSCGNDNHGQNVVSTEKVNWHFDSLEKYYLIIEHLQRDRSQCNFDSFLVVYHQKEKSSQNKLLFEVFKVLDKQFDQYDLYLESFQEEVEACGGGYYIDEKQKKRLKVGHTTKKLTELTLKNRKGYELQEKMNSFYTNMIDSVSIIVDNEADRLFLNEVFLEIFSAVFKGEQRLALDGKDHPYYRRDPKNKNKDYPHILFEGRMTVVGVAVMEDLRCQSRKRQVEINRIFVKYLQEVI